MRVVPLDYNGVEKCLIPFDIIAVATSQYSTLPHDCGDDGVNKHTTLTAILKSNVLWHSR